jgi:hypothetical protein
VAYGLAIILYIVCVQLGTGMLMIEIFKLMRNKDPNADFIVETYHNMPFPMQFKTVLVIGGLFYGVLFGLLFGIKPDKNK